MTYLPTQKSANPYILPTASPHFRKVQLEMLIDAVKDYAIFMLDAQGYVISWNSGAERIKGYTAAEIIGQHFSRFYPPEDQANHKPEHALATATSVGRYEDINWRVRKDGTRFWAHVILTPILGAEGELVGFAKVTRDLTEVRQADIALQESNERFRLLVESVSDYAIYLLDLEGRVVSWNRGAERIKGYKADEIIGQNFSRFYLAEDAAHDIPARHLEEAARQGRLEDEGWRVRKDGTRFWANALLTALYDAHGQLVGYAKVTRDLTERKEAEMKLAQSNALLRALSEHLDKLREDERQRVAHELHEEMGTSLTALKLELFRLRKAVGDDPGPAIGEPLTALNTMVDELISEARRLAMNMRPTLLEDLGLLSAIEWQLQEFQRNTGIHYQLSANADDLGLDRERATALFRVVQEVLTNVARHAQADQVRVWAERRPDGLLLQIQDDGRGITTREAEAPTSLGLVGLRERVRLLNGDIQIEGVPDRGTTVSITIPLPPNTVEGEE